MTTGEILRSAAARVRQGWCQHLLRVGGSHVCALGALGVTPSFDIRLTTDQQAAVLAIVRALGLRSNDPDFVCPYALVTVWNDAKGQTAENVAAGLEYAALVWEQSQAVAACSDAPRTVAGEVRG